MKTRKIIENQTVEARMDQIRDEIRAGAAEFGTDFTVRIIADLELSLRDALCDLERLRQGAA
jgi:uncharacterized protein YktB (UPF0637 family)